MTLVNDDVAQDDITTESVVVTRLEATGHLISTADGTLVISRCAGVGCSNCKRGIPVRRYKSYKTQWVPINKSLTFSVSTE